VEVASYLETAGVTKKQKKKKKVVGKKGKKKGDGNGQEADGGPKIHGKCCVCKDEWDRYVRDACRAMLRVLPHAVSCSVVFCDTLCCGTFF
jgi:hypothetical protein